MTTANSNLRKAKEAKNDEFYTMMTDVEKELKHYREHFQGKKVFLNCDDDRKSNFFRFFERNMDFFGIESLIATHYHETRPTYKIELFRDETGSITERKTPLEQNGDFRSPESIAILEEADIVVTNPPFSLFREYVAQLISFNKKFLIIGSLNAITYKEIFPLIKDNHLWLGVNNGAKSYAVPESYEGKCEVIDGVRITKLGNTGWFTNLEHQLRNEELFLFREYNEVDYPTYDNYDAIEASKVADIPVDYYGVMGVPITFLTKYNPNQFDILGITDRANTSGLQTKVYTKETPKYADLNARSVLKLLDGSYKAVYARILIQRKGV